MDFKTCKQPTYWEGRSNIQINLVTRTINWFEHRSLVWWILMVTRRQQSPFWSELLSHVKTNTAVLIKTKSYLLKSRRPNISLVLVLQTHFDSVANSAFHQRIIWMKPSPAWLMYKATCLCPLSWRIGRFFLAKHVCSRLCLQTQPWRKHYFLTFLGLLDLPRMLCAVDIICWPAYRLRLTNRDIARSPSLYWVRMFSFFFFFFVLSITTCKKCYDGSWHQLPKHVSVTCRPLGEGRVTAGLLPRVFGWGVRHPHSISDLCQNLGLLFQTSKISTVHGSKYDRR